MGKASRRKRERLAYAVSEFRSAQEYYAEHPGFAAEAERYLASLEAQRKAGTPRQAIWERENSALQELEDTNIRSTLSREELGDAVHRATARRSALSRFMMPEAWRFASS